MRWTSLLITVLCAGQPVAVVRADIPVPQPPSKEMSVIVEIDAHARRPRLVVPKAALERKVGLEPKVKDSVGLADHGSHTIVAGLALAAAIACGGLWLVHRQRHHGRGLARVLVAVGLLAAGAAVWANAPPPRRPPARPSLPKLCDGKIDVQVVDQGDSIRLIVTEAMLKELTKPPAANPE